MQSSLQQQAIQLASTSHSHVIMAPLSPLKFQLSLSLAILQFVAISVAITMLTSLPLPQHSALLMMLLSPIGAAVCMKRFLIIQPLASMVFKLLLLPETSLGRGVRLLVILQLACRTSSVVGQHQQLVVMENGIPNWVRNAMMAILSMEMAAP